MDTFRLLFRLALRNLAAHRVKSLLVGGILFFGTFLFVTGSALLDSIQASMQKSITSSLAGHLQLYAKDARDPLALFGDGSMSAADIGELSDFSPIREAVLKNPNVSAIVPMGQATATTFGANDIDEVLDDLRAAVNAHDAQKVPVLGERVRTIASDYQAQLQNRAELTSNTASIDEQREVLTTVQSAEFWDKFATDPLPQLDYLDGKLAPVAADGRVLYFRILGTDLDAFTRQFDRFEIVDGENIPPGKRGILIAKNVYENFVKNKVARELDAVYKAVHKDGKTIAEDSALRDRVARNSRAYQRVLFQLEPQDATDLEQKLGVLLPDVQGGLPEKLKAFLLVDDSNLDARYDWFYKEIAPKIRLYDLKIGDDVALRAFTKAGYLKSVVVRVYGTYNFKGLEDSTLAGAMNLTDMLTFREMYGKMSDAQRQELDELNKSVGVKDVSRDDAEAALFGGGGDAGGVEVVAEAAPTNFDEFASASLLDQAGRQRLLEATTITEDDINHGLALNAAILLKDPSKLAQTQQELTDTLAPLGAQVVDWKQASGIVGQLITILQIVLYVGIGVMLLVALVIINNAMVMATMERTGEIGTMRAIGAQRGFVTWMFVLETMLLGAIAGLLAAGASGALIAWLHHVGIPAGQDIMVVLYAGRRLYPVIGAGNVLTGLSLILLVSAAATIYPALLAAGVPPIVAMQSKE